MQAKHNSLRAYNSAAPAPAPAKAANKFWQFKNAADGSAEILLYGQIVDSAFWEDDVTAAAFKHDLDALGNVSNITVRINSGGGSVWAAQAIGNVLEDNPATVTARIDGLCASAATIVACHCDKVEAAADTMYMIHPVRVCADYATAEELETMAGATRKITDQMLDLYEKKTGQSRSDLTAWMNETRWMKSDEAKEKGFVDEIIDNGKAVAAENRNGLLFVNSVDVGLPFNAAPKDLQDKAASAAPDNKAPAGTPENNSHKEGEDMDIKTVEDARAAFPDLVAQIEKSAGQAAAKAEQERMEAIDKVAKLFPAELVAAAKYGENACDAKELAYRAALDSAERGRDFLNAREVDAQASGVKAVGSVPPEDKKPGAANSPAENSAQGKKDAQAFLSMTKGQVK